MLSREYAASSRFASRFFDSTCPRMIEMARCHLPDDLPIGPVHDDFAPRNLLVDQRGRLAPIDMLEEWVGCVWQDIGHFLGAVGTNKLQALGGGLAFSSESLTQIDSAFLRGYFGTNEIPWSCIRLYECMTVMNKWAAHVYQTRSKTLGALKGLPSSWVHRWYSHYVRRRLDCIEAPASDGLAEMPAAV